LERAYSFSEVLERVLKDDSRKKPSEKMSELEQLMREEGDLVAATIKYVGRHPETFEEALEKWKEEMRKRGESEEAIRKGEERLRKIMMYLIETT